MKALIIEKERVQFVNVPGASSKIIRVKSRGILLPESNNMLLEITGDKIQLRGNFSKQYTILKEVSLPQWFAELIGVLFPQK